MKLREDAFEIVHALRARDQMLPIKDHRGNPADALLNPKLLLLTHGVSKPLVFQNGFGFDAIKADFTSNLDQDRIIR